MIVLVSEREKKSNGKKFKSKQGENIHNLKQIQIFKDTVCSPGHTSGLSIDSDEEVSADESFLGSNNKFLSKSNKDNSFIS
jgi:hypothetical protein